MAALAPISETKVFVPGIHQVFEAIGTYLSELTMQMQYMCASGPLMEIIHILCAKVIF